MRKILIILLFLVNTYSYGQHMIINQERDMSYRSYRHSPIHKIESFSSLPNNIQFNTNGYLERFFGKMRDSLHYIQGQEVDLKTIFQKDSATFIGNAIKPKYILKFILADNSIGIKSYNLSLELDEYGQLLNINWPKEKWNKSNVIPRDTVKQFVLNYALSRRLDISNYKVYFNYYSRLDKLCWQFVFPDTVVSESNYYKREEKFKTIVIAWDELKIIQESQYTKVAYPRDIR
ncbi:hypothetical protein [Marinifilum sp. D714]|uniref:hypothetical protein n=1 Tax=Marinifilum sp. D714 TaxID=2937523 RepID=UPI0027C42139|nr:hypothetical protein [Marinifilum sp. D714]MDQ2179672.1 hypothetical protein [Marinifilum sp. D714]